MSNQKPPEWMLKGYKKRPFSVYATEKGWVKEYEDGKIELLKAVRGLKAKIDPAITTFEIYGDEVIAGNYIEGHMDFNMPIRMSKQITVDVKSADKIFSLKLKKSSENTRLIFKHKIKADSVDGQIEVLTSGLSGNVEDEDGDSSELTFDGVEIKCKLVVKAKVKEENND